jgi:hypothetical protein
MTEQHQVLEDDSFEFQELSPELKAALEKDATRRSRGFAQPVESGSSSFGVDGILDQRHRTHGTFMDVAGCSQVLKETIQLFLEAGDKTLAADQQESLDLICTKIARVVCGDADHTDTWLDIAGYAQLIVDRLEGKAR